MDLYGLTEGGNDRAMDGEEVGEEGGRGGATVDGFDGIKYRMK